MGPSEDLVSAHYSSNDLNPDDPPEFQQDQENQKRASSVIETPGRTAPKRQKRVHANVPCGKCGKTFFNSDGVKRHMEDGHRDSLLKCDQCDFTCKPRRSMIIHVQGVHEGKLLSCKLCNFKANANPKNLVWHIQSKHAGMEYEFATGKRIVVDKRNKRKHLCEKCDFRAYTKQVLRDHIKSVHDGDPYECEKCHKTFISVYSLTGHYREQHEKVKYSCDKCPKAFSLEHLLETHKYEIHIKKIKNRNKIRKCQECNEEVLGSGRLHRHFHFAHMKYNEKCPKCGKIRNMDGTVRTMSFHQMENNYNKKIKESEANQNQHSAEKMIVPTFKTPKIEHDLDVDYDIKQETDEIKYPCHICDNEFCDQNSLKKHVILHLKLSKP